MKKNWISLVSVGIICLGICLSALYFIQCVVDEMDRMRLSVMETVEQRNTEEAFGILSEMASFWEKRESFLETIAFHESLHDISAYLIEADANLKKGDTDDFYRSIALLGEALFHLYEEERFKISNIL